VPDAWIATGVKYDDDQDAVWLDAIEHGVWESSHEGTTDILKDDAVHLWSLGDPVERLPHPVDEADTQPRPLLHVPIERLVKVQASLTLQDYRERQRRERSNARARTSSQRMTSSGDRSWAAIRRSSSSRCAALSGSCSGSAAMLSQIASTS
jgi:hypothetical protein